MKKAKQTDDVDIRAEYRRADLGKLERGRYAKRLAGMASLVALDPDVAASFPDSQAVNEALRTLLRIRIGTRRKRAGSKRS